MKKVVIFNGSPRMDGNTATILKMIERGAREHHAEVKSYTLFKMKFMACQGCFGCRMQEDCMVNDELKKALSDVKDADAVVIGSPVYFMQVTGPVKNMYDRFFPLIGEGGAPRFGEKKIVTVYSQDHEDPDMFRMYFDYLAVLFPGFGFVQEERVVCVGANNPETAEKDGELKRRAYEIGRRLAVLES